MAVFRGDAERALERARMARTMPEKVEALEDAVAELLRELGHVLGHLGSENFKEE